MKNLEPKEVNYCSKMTNCGVIYSFRYWESKVRKTLTIATTCLNISQVIFKAIRIGTPFHSCPKNEMHNDYSKSSILIILITILVSAGCRSHRACGCIVKAYARFSALHLISADLIKKQKK